MAIFDQTVNAGLNLHALASDLFLQKLPRVIFDNQSDWQKFTVQLLALPTLILAAGKIDQRYMQTDQALEVSNVRFHLRKRAGVKAWQTQDGDWMPLNDPKTDLIQALSFTDKTVWINGQGWT